MSTAAAIYHYFCFFFLASSQVGLAAACGLVSVGAGIGVICSVIKIKQKKAEEMKPLLDPNLPATIVHEYFAKRRGKHI